MEDSHESIQQFFIEHGRVASTIPVEDIPLNSCSINSILRPYQRETVKWMISRELTPASVQIGTHSISLPRGGILADEMGLGKTVEMLACILGNARRKVDSRRSPPGEDCRSPPRAEAEAEAENSCTSLGKRLAETAPAFLAKKPRIDEMKLNPVLRGKIQLLLSEFYGKFQRARRMKQKIENLNEVCREIITSVFSVLLVHLYFNTTSSPYAQQQAWAFLVSDFDAHRESSLAYTILVIESQEFENFPESNAVSKENAQSVITLVQEFFTDGMTMKMIVKEFDRVLMSGREFGQIVQCRCGEDNEEGDNVTCSKCKKQQHLTCVGLSRVPANEENYVCPSCWMNETPIKSAATLMVIPDTLTQQWADEINKHASDCDLKIFWYRGVSKGYILPTALSEYDIVLITTANLAADLNFVNPNGRTLRHAKRYQYFVTPLTCIQWWRLCIDEAQSVEGVNKVSEMAARLRTEHLWAITGTPISRSLRDLYGLTVYLRMEPFVESDALWSELISGDQSKLHLLFAHLMRRKTKDQVRNQLGLPPLTYDVQWLSFPPVEGYHYDAMQAKSQKAFLLAQKPNVSINWNQPLETANKAFVKSILTPLLALRKVCVNPMRCSKHQRKRRKVDTYQTLLERMVRKTKTDCENLLRSYVMFVNGRGRVHMCVYEIDCALKLYRDVLEKFAFYADLTPDDFQHIHVMHQILEAVRLDPTVELTDEEKLFPSKMAEIEAKCVNKLQDEIDSLKTQMSKVSTEIENYTQTYELKEVRWWEQILSSLDFKDVKSRIIDNLGRDNIKLNAAMLFKMSSAKHLGAAIESWLQDVERVRGVIFECLEDIMKVDSRNSSAIAARNCHGGTGEKNRTCAVCRTEDLMKKYEALLFSAIDQGALEDTAFTETNWKPTALEVVLNVLLSCSRATNISAVNHAAATQQLEALSGLRCEFKWIRAVWSRQSDLLNVCEEIIIAKSRMDDNVSMRSGDPQYRNEIATSARNSASVYSDLRKKYGSLQYLKNLDREYKSGEEVEGMCPVCQSSLHDQRAVLTCGHFTCHSCMQSMIKNGDGNNHIRCPVCRSEAPIPSISYVRGGGRCELSDPDPDVIDADGRHPVKIREITATVLRLIQEDAHVKILIFSTWEKILDAIEKAFVENKISSRKYTNGQMRITSLSEFKTRNDVNVLLMPLKSGSKGLNLTEASHIIFAEPVLNTADEEQAVGRIYRMGQERPMTVHKFIMKGSVEEKIHEMNEEFSRSSDCKESQLKLGHLRDLFETSARNQTEAET